MEAFLTTKDLCDIVDGMEVRPAGSDNTKAVKSWQMKQRLARVLSPVPEQHRNTETWKPILSGTLRTPNSETKSNSILKSHPTLDPYSSLSFSSILFLVTHP